MIKRHTIPRLSNDVILADIRAKCLDCCGGSRNMVEECRSRECRLHKYRNARTMEQTQLFGDSEQLPGQIDVFGGQIQ